MSDPVMFTVLGAFATEGIKFLYGQADELIRAWRERREQVLDDGFPVAIVESSVLDAQPAQGVADPAVMEPVHRRLVGLMGLLSPYALGQAEVDLSDQELAAAAEQLRELLEAALGQRFTFRGEQRDPTGSKVVIRQILDRVGGSVKGLKGDVRPGSDVLIDQKASDVLPGAELVGVWGTVGR